MSNNNIILISFKYFLNYLQPSLFIAKGIDIESAYIKSIYIEDINAVIYLKI